MATHDSASAPQNHCKDCGLYFDSVKSLDVHLHYHKENLLSKWATTAAAARGGDEANNNNTTTGGAGATARRRKAPSAASVTTTAAAAAPADSAGRESPKSSPGPARSRSSWGYFSAPAPSPGGYSPTPQQQTQQFGAFLQSQQSGGFQQVGTFGLPHSAMFHNLPHQLHQHHQQLQQQQQQQQQQAQQQQVASSTGLYPSEHLELASPSPLRFHPYRPPQQVQQQQQQQPPPPSSPAQCERCGHVCESDRALADHSAAAHPPTPASPAPPPDPATHDNSVSSTANPGPPSQRRTPPRPPPPQDNGQPPPQAPGSSEADATAEILDLDSHKVHVYQEEEDARVQHLPHSVSAMLWGHPQQHQHHQQHLLLMDQHHHMQQQHHFQQQQQQVAYFGAPAYLDSGQQVFQPPPPQPPPPQPPPGSPAPGTPPSATSGSNGNGSWKSNEPRRPKTYNCSACKKWFTSSGHLKRHYNTTLHKNAVKQSGQPDPAGTTVSAQGSNHQSAASSPASAPSPGGGDDSFGSSGDRSTPVQPPGTPTLLAQPQHAAMFQPQFHSPHQQFQQPPQQQQQQVLLHQQQHQLLQRHPADSDVRMSLVTEGGLQFYQVHKMVGHPPTTNGCGSPPGLDFSQLQYHQLQQQHQQQQAEGAFALADQQQQQQMQMQQHHPNAQPPHASSRAEQAPSSGSDLDEIRQSHPFDGALALPSFAHFQLVDKSVGGPLLPHRSSPPDMAAAYSELQRYEDPTTELTEFVKYKSPDLDSVKFEPPELKFEPSEIKFEPVEISFTKFEQSGPEAAADSSTGGTDLELGPPSASTVATSPPHSPDPLPSSSTPPDDPQPRPLLLTFTAARAASTPPLAVTPPGLPGRPRPPRPRRPPDTAPSDRAVVSSTTPPVYNSSMISSGSLHMCLDCDKVFNKACYLTQHNKSFHSGHKPFKCNRCGKRFPTDELYREHCSKHAGDKPYKCGSCPKQFNHKTDLRRHMCLHTGEKPYACDVCGKGFIRKDHMLKHCDTHRRKLNGGAPGHHHPSTVLQHHHGQVIVAAQ